MSEELNLKNLEKEFTNWNFLILGATTINQLKNSHLIENKDYSKINTKKPDGLILEEKRVIALLEGKLPKEFNTERLKQKAIKQELEVAKQLKTKLMIVTDTIETLWCNVLREGELITDQKGNVLKQNFKDLDSKELEELIIEIIDSINKDGSQLKTKEERDPTNLAKSIWQDIWSVSGATPENCLYTFVELFIFKYLSDLEILTEPENFEYLMKLYSKRDEQFVLEYYANTIRPKIKYDLFPMNIKDKTTIINGTIFVSKDEKAVEGYSTVFKKILTKFQDYGKLENISYDFKSKLFESFLKESISKKNWGQFFTPLKVVRAVSKMFNIRDYYGKTICDPACGVGKFLLEPLLKDIDLFYEVKNNKLKSNITIHGFDKGFDTEEQKTIILAKANMLIYFSDLLKKNPKITQQFSTLFNESFELKTNSILGSLRYPIKEKYDLILTNPPYVTSGSSNLKEEISKDTELQNYYSINALGVEGLFMEWIIRALKKGGKAFVIIPDGILNRINDKKLRKFILETCNIDAIISLPSKTFFTTIKKTYILVITKKLNESEKQKEPVFTYLVNSIGEKLDVNRFDVDENDLEESVKLFNQFKNSKNHFKSEDKRCKIIPITKLYDDFEKHWVIDRWWSKEEKVYLGIEEKIFESDIKTFSEMFQNFSEKIDESKTEISILKNEKIEFKTLKIDEIFNLAITTNRSEFTKDFINKNKGNIPVYSASKKESAVDYGYVKDNLDGIKYFKDCLTWNIDGSVEKPHYRKGYFSLSEKVIPLIIFDKYKGKLDIEYLKFEIEHEFAKKNFGFGHKAGKGRIKHIEIKIPINEKKELDIVKQKEISDKHNQIQEIKKSLSLEFEKIINVKVDFFH